MSFQLPNDDISDRTDMFCLSVSTRSAATVSLPSRLAGFRRRFLTGAVVLLQSIVPASAMAATTVSGSISTNTIWAASQSPYDVTADVSVDNGATLTIEAGVTVRLGTGINLTVNQGALIAKGSTTQPIVLTSVRDQTGANPAAAPGDWGQLQFRDGTLDSAATLDYVQVKYGHGIAVTAASPLLNRIALLNNAGPAIALDLDSSPVGAGLTASGNDVNGILVPAGHIVGSLKWGLVGIPYVVASGILYVGQASIELDPPSSVVKPGDTATMKVTLMDAAPSGGLSIALATDAAGILSVPSSVTVPAGQKSVGVGIVGVGLGLATLTATATGVGSATASLEVRNPPALSLSPPSLSIAPGSSRQMTLSASDPIPLGGRTVTLTNSNAATFAVPTSVFLPAGASSTVFSISALVLGTSSLTAHAIGYADATATLNAPAALLTLPTDLLVSPGRTTTFEVGLSAPAPAGGMTLSLASSTPGVATVSSSISVSGGSTSGQAVLTGVGAGSSTISVSGAGYQPATSQARVIDVSLFLTPAPAAIPRGVSQNLAAGFSAYGWSAAPPGGIPVSVSNGNPSIATATPTTVNIPAGATSSSAVTLTGMAQGTTTLTLSSPGLRDRAYELTVGDPGNLAFNPTAVTVGKGLRAGYGEAFVRLRSGTDPYYSPVAVPIRLTSADPSHVSVDSIVTVYSTMTVPVTGVELTTTPVVVDAGSDSGYLGPTEKLAVSVVTPDLLFQNLWNYRAPDDVRDDFQICWSVNGSRQVSATDIVVALGVAGASPAGAVSGFYAQAQGGSPITQAVIPAGQNCSLPIYVAAPSPNGSYSVSASAANGASATSALQTVETPTLSFGQPALTLAEYVTNWISVVRRTSDGAGYGGSAIVVALVSSDPSKLTVPATVTIPAGQSSVSVPVVPSGASGGTPITVTASVAGYDTQPVTVTINPVSLGLQGLEGARQSGAPRDDFRVCWNYWVYYLNDWPVAATATLNLVQNPAGIVGGFYDALTGGNLVTQVTIPHGQQCSEAVYVDSPTSNGTYDVVATAPDGTFVSSTQTVGGPTLSFSETSLKAGLGLQPPTVYVDRLVAGMAAAPASPLEVTLVSSDPSTVAVPATVTIPAGSWQIGVPLTIKSVSAVPVNISASANGVATAAPLPVSVVMPIPIFGNLATILDITRPMRNRLTLCLGVDQNIYGTPSADIDVDIGIVSANPTGIVSGIYGSNATDDLTPVTRVTFQGGNYGCKSLYIGEPTAVGTYGISASGVGIAGASSPIQSVVAPALRFMPASTIVGKGLTSDAVTIQRWFGGTTVYGGDALDVTLSSTDPTKVGFFAIVTIPAGSDSVTIPLTGLDLTGSPVAITANASGYGSPDAPLSVSVTPSQLSLWSLDGGRVVAGPADDFLVCWSAAGSDDGWQSAPSDLTVSLSVSDQMPDGIVAGFHDGNGSPVSQVTIPAGTYCSDTYFVDAAGTAGTYRINGATQDGMSIVSDVQTVGVPSVQLWERNAAGQPQSNAVVGNGLVDPNVEVQLVVNGYPVLNNEDVTVALACTDATICSTPASATISAGSTFANVEVSGVALGTTTLTASAAGYASISPLSVSVATPKFGFEMTPLNTSDCQGNGAWFGIYPTVTGAVNAGRQSAQADVPLSFTSTLVAVSETDTLYDDYVRFLVHSPVAGTGSITVASPGFSTTVSPPIPVTTTGPGSSSCNFPS